MRGFPVSPYVTILSPAHPKVNPVCATGEEPLTPNVFLGVVPCSILPRSQVAEIPLPHSLKLPLHQNVIILLLELIIKSNYCIYYQHTTKLWFKWEMRPHILVGEWGRAHRPIYTTHLTPFEELKLIQQLLML